MRRSLRLELLESRRMLSGVPLITEFMAINHTTNADEDGNFTDWIEIHNPDPVSLELTGWYLTDKPDELDRWAFPDVTLDVNEYLVVRASGLDRLGTGPNGEYHTNFSLSGEGEYLALVAPDGHTVVQEFVSDGGQYPQQVADISYGLVLGTTEETFFLSPTPGAANSGPTSDDPLCRIVINEIMYHADSLIEAEEYIELFNNGDEAVDLSGWSFSSGVGFDFPQGTTLDAGRYLVVVADLAVFSAKYPSVDPAIIHGNWQGRLGNSSETIELIDQRGDLIDRVTYADQGDWAERARGPDDHGHHGWEWNALHDAGGRSLELIHPGMPNDQGQNWASSDVPQGTPGSANSVASNDIAPIITDVRQSIWIPSSTDAVTITAHLRDESTGPLAASLFYRVDGTGDPFSEQVMADDGLHGDGGVGDATFGATIPEQADGTIVEFYIRASDPGSNVRTWPGPAVQLDLLLAQTANALYQVDDSFSGQYEPGDQPTIFVIMTEAERAELADIGSGTVEEAESNAQMNGTFIILDGTGMNVRYTTGVRNRGGGSRNDPPNNFRINIPSDRPWNDVDAITVNSKYPHSQLLGTVLFQAAGLVAEDSRAVQLRVNGTNLAEADPTMFDTYVQIEALGSIFAKNHFPGDGNGNLYSIRDALPEEGDLRYEGTDPDAYRDTYFKNTNEDFDDWSDLIALTDALNNSTDEQFFAAVSAVANLEEWFRYFAVDTLLLNEEGGLPTGRGDDYTIYRGLDDPRFVLIPHDLDTLLDQGNNSPNTTRSVFGYENVNGMARLFSHPDTVGLYYRSLLEVANTVFLPERVNDLIDQLLGDWVPEQVVQNYKATFAARREFVLSQIPTELTVNSNLPRVGEAQILRTTDGTTVSLSGTAHAGSTRSVFVNGVEADWDARGAEWSLDTLPLNPGLNRLTVQAFDGPSGAGTLVDARSIDIWYDRGGMTEVTTIGPGNVTWSAAAGPYHLSEDVTVPVGVALTIEPGTSVFFDEGVELRVEGILVAAGTQFGRIRFSSVPDAPFVPDEPAGPGLPDGPPRWAGIHLVDTMADENIIAFADIEYAQDNVGNLGAIGVIRSQAVLDNLTFQGNHLHQIYGVSPSWVISNSIFPDVFAEDEHADILGLDNVSESIESDGITPLGGRYIIANNVFGTTKGHNDVIDAESGWLANGEPIVQIIDNIFLGVGDEHLDLGGDVYVAGNVFMNVFKDDETSDLGYANAISTGDSGAQSTIAAVRNVFWDIDHAINLKQDAATLFENNTVVTVHPDFLDVHGNLNVGSAIPLWVDEPGATAGAGAYASGNIFWDMPRIFGGADLPTGTVSHLEFVDNFLDPLLATSTVGSRPGTILDLGTGHIIGDVHFVDLAGGRFELGSGSQARGTGPFGIDFGALVPEGAWIAGQPQSVTDATDANLTIGGPGIMAYRYRINGGAWSGEIPIGSGFAFGETETTVRTATLELSGLADGTYTVDVIGRDFAGNWQDASSPTTVSWTVDTVGPLPRDIVINEVLAQNVGAIDLGGTRPDAIELFNRGAAAVDLGGFSLTDDIDRPDRYVFPEGTMLESGEYLVVYADSKTPVGDEIHLGFGLEGEGEGVYLIDWENHTPGDSVVPMDGVEFGMQLVDRSIARLAGAGWGLAVPTFGSANLSQPLGNPADLTINEWFATGTYELGGELHHDDFVELYNASALPVALGGLYLTDDPVARPNKQMIQSLSFIGPGGCTVFAADGNLDRGPDHVGFALADERGWIALFDADWTMLDSVFYGPQTSGVSQGRAPDGWPEYAFFVQPTPGLDTSPPSIPTGLSLDVATDNQVDFHWNPSTDPQSGVVSYRIYRNSVAIADTSATSYSDTAIVPGGIYYYQVAAINGDGIESPLSASLGNRPDTSPPSVPTGLTGTVVSSAQINLVWNPSSDPETGVSFYTILRNGVEIGTSTDTTFSDTTFASSTSISYRATATNSQEVTSDASLPWSVIAFQQGVSPSAGYNGTSDTWISENTGAVNSNYADDIELEIDGSDPLETLALIRWDVSDIPAGSVIDGAAITVYVNDSSSGQAYEFYSANREWIDDQTTWNVACTGAPWQTPGARGLQDRGSEVLGMMAPTAVGSFTYALNAAGIALVQQWIDDPSTNYGLIISDEYNTNGIEFDSSESATLSYRPRLTLSFRGADDTPPSIPTGLIATDDGISSIALSWEASTDLESGIAGYRVFRDSIEIGTTTTTSFLDINRDTNTVYSYAILAINGQGGESALCSPAVEHQIIPKPIQVELSVRDSYLSDSAILVRVAVHDPQGNIARDLWNATATLTTDDPLVTLSSHQVALINGLGSALVTFSGGSDFTLYATIAGNVDSRELTSLDGGPQTEVSGYQSGIWSGVVHVIGDVTVPGGQTLTLEPGTLVLLDGDPVGATDSTQIVIAGTLDSRGTADRPITFTAVDPENPWGEIDIDGGTAIFDYTVVTRAGNSPRGGHTETGPAFRLHNDASLQFTNGSVANIHGKIMQATGGDVIINDSLLTRAVMGPEISATSLLFRDNWIVDMNRSWHYNNVDNDNDGIYLHTQSAGQTLSLERSVVALVGDDCVDTLNSEVVAREMIVRDAVDKGFSINGGTILIERSLIVDTGVGIQTKGNSTFAPQTRVDRTTISGVHVGIVMRELSASVVYDVVNTIIHVNPMGDPLLNEVAPDGNDRFHINYSLFDEPWEFAGSGIGNIESNSPMFVDLAGKDFRLQANSPAVDSGDPTSTPDDDGTRADMGAFATMQHAGGDFNRDGNVDGQDLAQWEGDFGVNGESDSDGDGDSDGNDFLAWQRNFGSTSPSSSADKSSTGSGANDHGKSMFFGIANATSDSSNNTKGDPVGLVRRSIGNGQDTFFLPPARQEISFDAFNDTGWSLLQPLAKSIVDTIPCLDPPHFQSPDASGPFKRCHVNDDIMSRLEGQAAQTDLESMDRGIREITLTDFTEYQGDILFISCQLPRHPVV